MRELFFLVLILSFSPIYAQEEQSGDSSQTNLTVQFEELKGTVEALYESFTETKNTVDQLKKLKFSGYLQTQFQSGESDGIKSFSGGNFSSGMHNRFMIRRGRLKAVYDNELSKYILQIDATEKGLALKDAYINLTDPWLRLFTFNAGVFNRPFGYEIGYSSSDRESPERSRVFQTLFPGERDLGASIEFRGYEGWLSYFNIKAGLFAGNGVNVETDNQKDFIGRLGFTFPFEELYLAIDGGFSGYYGKVKRAEGKSIFDLSSYQNAEEITLANWAERKYIGFDLQLYYDLPLLGAFSVKGELLKGQQPATQNNTISFTNLPSNDIYIRNFTGYYLVYVQNIGEHNQFLVKYDFYDPNTDVEGEKIGKFSNAKLSYADLNYSTIGLGWVHYWDANVKFVFYYDIVKNESSQFLPGYEKDLKDNVFTFRIQYKF